MHTLQLTIQTIQPVKIMAQGSQSEIHSSYDYLTGSAIRGALLALYFKQHPLMDLDQEIAERRRWLNGNTRFLNGYPLINEQRSHPFPQHLFAEKNSIKRYESGESEQLELINPFMTQLNNNEKRLNYQGFTNLTANQSLTRIKTQKKFFLHVSHSQKKNNLFRYEAIEEGQTFVALIKTDDPTLLAFLQNLTNQNIHLGGSRTSGYGKCLITAVESCTDDTQTLQTRLDRIHDEQLFYLFAKSDLILNDEHGYATLTVPIAELAQQLGDKGLPLADNEPKTNQELAQQLGDRGLSIVLTQTYLQTIEVGGYIEKWRAPLPLRSAIQKGSIFQFKIISGQLDRDALMRLTHNGLGERTIEGFGEVEIADSTTFTQKIMTRYRLTQPIQLSQTGQNHSSQTQVDQQLFEQVKNQFAEKIKEKTLKQLVLSLAKTTQMLKTNPSQIGNLINLVYNARMLLESAEQHNEAKARSRISAYLKHLEYREDGQRRKNKHAYKQLEQLHIKNESSITFLDALHKDTDHFYKKYMPSMDESLKTAQKFHLSLLFAEKYFKFLLRIKSSEKNNEA